MCINSKHKKKIAKKNSPMLSRLPDGGDNVVGERGHPQDPGAHHLEPALLLTILLGCWLLLLIMCSFDDNITSLGLRDNSLVFVS